MKYCCGETLEGLEKTLQKDSSPLHYKNKLIAANNPITNNQKKVSISEENMCLKKGFFQSLTQKSVSLH